MSSLVDKLGQLQVQARFFRSVDVIVAEILKEPESSSRVGWLISFSNEGLLLSRVPYEGCLKEARDCFDPATELMVFAKGDWLNGIMWCAFINKTTKATRYSDN